jgi:hypothetical protein
MPPTDFVISPIAPLCTTLSCPTCLPYKQYIAVRFCSSAKRIVDRVDWIAVRGLVAFHLQRLPNLAGDLRLSRKLELLRACLT